MRFGKDVFNLIFSPAGFHDDIPFLNIISQKVMPDINVLCSFMLDQILSHVDCTYIITHESDGVDVDSKILKLFYPKKLGTKRINYYILNLSY